VECAAAKRSEALKDFGAMHASARRAIAATAGVPPAIDFAPTLPILIRQNKTPFYRTEQIVAKGVIGSVHVSRPPIHSTTRRSR
jgi:hypothetical protein